MDEINFTFWISFKIILPKDILNSPNQNELQIKRYKRTFWNKKINKIYLEYQKKAIEFLKIFFDIIRKIFLNTLTCRINYNILLSDILTEYKSQAEAQYVKHLRDFRGWVLSFKKKEVVCVILYLCVWGYVFRLIENSIWNNRTKPWVDSRFRYHTMNITFDYSTIFSKQNTYLPF